MYGWWGKIARIDLDTESVTIETADPALLRRFIGGRGLAGYFLNDRITLSFDDPDMPICLFTGPLVGTAAPTSGRMTFMSRSPLTGAVGDASVGGSFATELKKAGYEGIVIVGRHDGLCGIEISDDRIRIVSAAPLSGATAADLAHQLKDKGASAVIGPAAENGVRFANVIIDGHYAAGRTGLGLVFANKKIKYITVSGTQAPAVYDKKRLKAACADVIRLVSASPALMGEFGIARFGTGALYDLMDARSMMPTENFRKSKFPDAPFMNAVSYKSRYGYVRTGCRGCHIRCKKKGKNNTIIPEFETMSHFSALVGNSDMDTVTEANRICNTYGMDTISAAATLACYFEIKQMQPKPGEILNLLEMIGQGKNIGRNLGMGAARYAKGNGRPDLAMAVKQMELPAYDPRGAYGMALAYAVSTRGGCHLRAYPISHEILRKPVPTNRFTFEGKARIIKTQEDINAAADSLTACKFIFFAATLEEYARIFTAVTGVDLSGQDLLKAGERICYNERIMNAKNGFSSCDDDLPPRFFSPRADGEKNAGSRPIDRKDFLAARAAYYIVRELTEDGYPTEAKARELELDFP